MQVRRNGRDPQQHFTIITNALARDTRLSFRARGIMLLVLSHADGWHMNSDTLAREAKEGRDAIRSAMNELIVAGYMRRVRVQDEGGQWRTELHVYAYGDAPAQPESATPEPLDEVTSEDIDEAMPPTTGNQASVPQASIEDQPEDSQSPAAALSPEYESGSPSEVTTEQQQEVSQVVTREPRRFPPVEQRKLMSWWGIGDERSAQAWEAAWATAEAITSDEVYYDPEAHLAIYLSKCREERRPPRSDLWLRFFIEDRAKHIAVLQSQAEREERAEEDPQQREDRISSKMPPTEWGVTSETEEQG